MLQVAQVHSARRYTAVAEKKASGVTYTPRILADFVASQIIKIFALPPSPLSVLRVLDPAVGDGELLVSLLNSLRSKTNAHVEVHGFETDVEAIEKATLRLGKLFPRIELKLECGSFLDFVSENFGPDGNGTLFKATPDAYDLIIANPPYVRTQILGSDQAKEISQQFGLTGRVDLYHAFLACMARVLKPCGVAGVITSNRFMTTRAGAAVRRELRQRFCIRHIWDLGDTKLFEAAVLPAVLLLEGKNKEAASTTPGFTSIYETRDPAQRGVIDPLQALEQQEGVVGLPDGRRFTVQHGTLPNTDTKDSVWRVATTAGDAWLARVKVHSWGTFRDIGKIRVGVKTCADKVFIRSDWNELSASERPELLRPVTTHHMARRFKPMQAEKRFQILYPHEALEGQRRAIDLSHYPRSRVYLEGHRRTLAGRKYLDESGRQWHEIWVPQDPALWKTPKLVFRDITEEPVFWLDLDGTVVNGDCYWLIAEKPDRQDLLWLAAAVGNSTFVESFYDRRFHNKLYAGRRRFITQYVEQFPLPDPTTNMGRNIIAKAMEVYDSIDMPKVAILMAELDHLVWEAFGLSIEEVGR